MWFYFFTMFLRGLRFYRDSFTGFNPQVWFIALATLINRAGTMVVPFLSLYLTEDMHFSLGQVGWIMSCFGIGSLVGSWLGGKLSDSIGFYPTMIGSLMLTGIGFVFIQFIETFYGFCIGIILLMSIADTFRPAMFVALRTYSKPENRTRAVTLIRLAINLGFSAGPAIGGFLIMNAGYSGLFWVDGITCVIAALLLLITLNMKEAASAHADNKGGPQGSPYKDVPYLVFLLGTFLVSATFLQFFSTIPLYFREVHLLQEKEIGLLLASNGLIIFLIEMPLIKYFDNPRFSIYRILAFSTFLILMSFLVFNLSSWKGVLIISILFMTIGEMLNFPFMNRFSMERADRGKSGAYMALYTIAFSLSHVVSHNSGMHLIEHFGYDATWYVMTAFLAIACVIFLLVKPLIDREKKRESQILTAVEETI